MQAKNLEELELQAPFLERTLRPLVGRLSGSVPRVTSASFADRTEKNLAMAGNPGDLRVSDWLGIKAVSAIVFGIIFFLLFAVVNILGTRLRASAPCMSLLGVVIGYIAPEFWLGRRIKARKKAILLMIPDALDLLTISVRAGLGFDAALGKVVEKLKGPLSDEFRRAMAEIRVGKTRREALRDIIPRTEVPPLTNFIGAVIQAETLGVSISKVLQVQSEQLRIERRQRAEEQAAKAPIKMLFPLVGLHLPVAVHRHPRAGDHPDRQEPQDVTARGAVPARVSRPDGRAQRGPRTAMTSVRNVERGTVLAEQLESANSLWAKFCGLMGRAIAGRRRRTVAARQQRDPHDVHALRDRRRLRGQARGRRQPRGPRRSIGPCRPGAAWSGWSAAPTARSSSRSARSTAARPQLGTSCASARAWRSMAVARGRRPG